MNSARYTFLACLPLLVGMACVSGPLVTRVYGADYIPMGRVLAIVALLAIPKAMMSAPSSLLQASERQRHLILWGCIGGAVDVALDLLLVRAHGATGAAVANGAGQAVAAAGVWFSAWKLSGLDLRIKDFARIAAAGAMMAAVVLGAHRSVPGTVGLGASIAAGAVAWVLALRFVRVLDAVDATRLLSAGKALPGRLRPFWARVVGFVIPAQGVA